MGILTIAVLIIAAVILILYGRKSMLRKVRADLSDLIELEGQLFFSNHQREEQDKATRYGSLLFYVKSSCQQMCELVIQQVDIRHDAFEILHFAPLDYNLQDDIGHLLRSLSFKYTSDQGVRQQKGQVQVRIRGLVVYQDGSRHRVTETLLVPFTYPPAV